MLLGHTFFNVSVALVRLLHNWLDCEVWVAECSPERVESQMPGKGAGWQHVFGHESRCFCAPATDDFGRPSGVTESQRLCTVASQPRERPWVRQREWILGNVIRSARGCGVLTVLCVTCRVSGDLWVLQSLMVSRWVCLCAWALCHYNIDQICYGVKANPDSCLHVLWLSHTAS